MKTPCFVLLAATLTALSAVANDASTRSARAGELITVIQSSSGHKEKADACRELAVIGTPEAIAPLVKLLADENLSHMARYALEPMPGSEVDKALRDALPNLSGRSLAGVVSTLGVRRDTKAVKPLTGLLRSSDADVAQAAARALGNIGTAAAAEALTKELSQAKPENKLAVYEGLLRSAERLRANGKIRPAREIYASLKTAEAPHQVRAGGLRGVILTSEKQAPLLLADALRDEDYTQFAAALKAAMELSGPAVNKALAAQLPKLPAERQVAALQTLAWNADPVAMPAVVNASRSSDKMIKLAAIRALPQFQNPSAAPVLLEFLGESDKDVARAAQDGLAGLPGREVDTAVVSLLSNANKDSRLTGLELISRRRMSTALPEVSKLAADSDSQVRASAIRSVGDLGGTAQLPFLLDILQQPKSNQDLEAAESALEVVSVKPGNREQAVTAIQGELAKAQPTQKVAMLRVLTTVGGKPALESVRASLKDSNPQVRSAAVRALSGWSSQDAAPDLLQLARSGESTTEKTVSLRGYLAMAGRGDVPEAERVEMLRQVAPLVERPEEKRLLLSALGGITSPQALQLLEPHLADPAVKEEAATATVTIADKLLKRDNAAQVAGSLIQPLEKVAENSGNEKVAERAKALLKDARSKAK